MTTTIKQIVARKKAERERLIQATKPNHPEMTYPRSVPTLSRDAKTEQKMQTTNFLTRFWFAKGKCSATRPKC